MNASTLEIQQIYDKIQLLPVERLPELFTFVEFLGLKTPEQSLVLPQMARRRANVYLGCHVTMMTTVAQPTLVHANPPLWQMPIHLQLRGQGVVGKVGELAVNALTGEVIALSEAQIIEIRQRCHELIARTSPATAPAG